MRQISLTKGFVALVDDDDYEVLASDKWCVSAYGYAVRGVTVAPGRHAILLLGSSDPSRRGTYQY